MRREEGRDLVQDPAKKGQRLASRADSVAATSATPVSNSSHGAANAGLPTTLLCMHDSHFKASQVKDSNGQDQDQALQSFGRGELNDVDLIAARFFITKACFDMETQASVIYQVASTPPFPETAG